jgi:FMN-dependent NADH-azoreductase
MSDMTETLIKTYKANQAPASLTNLDVLKDQLQMVRNRTTELAIEHTKNIAELQKKEDE